MKIRTNCKLGLWGSYILSCEDVSETPQADGSLYLAGVCQDHIGYYRNTNLIVPPGFNGSVANCDGRLTLGDS